MDPFSALLKNQIIEEIPDGIEALPQMVLYLLDLLSSEQLEQVRNEIHLLFC